MKKEIERNVSAIQCYLAYISALSAAIISWFVLAPYIDNLLLRGLIVTSAATMIIWIFSIANGNSSIYDPYWVIAPPFLALAFLFSNTGVTNQKILMVLLFWIWSLRYHIFYSWTGWRTGLTKEDWRYEDMRRFPLPYWLNSLLGMHLFPTLLVYTAFLPAAMILSDPKPEISTLGPWDVLATVLALTAILLEYYADKQLSRYRKSPEYKKGGTFRKGLWRFSRHPNYFGEVLFWLSFIAFSHSKGNLISNPVLTLTGPLLMAAFFRFSAWLTDKRSLERRPGYQKLIDEVSALVPWIPKKKNRM